MLTCLLAYLPTSLPIVMQHSDILPRYGCTSFAAARTDDYFIFSACVPPISPCMAQRYTKWNARREMTKKKKTLKEVKIKFYTNFTPIPEGQGLCRRAVHGSKRSARAVAIKCLASVGNERTCSLAQ